MGRMEQLETSEQAKSRGSTSVSATWTSDFIYFIYMFIVLNTHAIIIILNLLLKNIYHCELLGLLKFFYFLPLILFGCQYDKSLKILLFGNKFLAGYSKKTC